MSFPNLPKSSTAMLPLSNLGTFARGKRDVVKGHGEIIIILTIIITDYYYYCILQ